MVKKSFGSLSRASKNIRESVRLLFGYFNLVLVVAAIDAVFNIHWMGFFKVGPTNNNTASANPFSQQAYLRVYSVEQIAVYQLIL